MTSYEEFLRQIEATQRALERSMSLGVDIQIASKDLASLVDASTYTGLLDVGQRAAAYGAQLNADAIIAARAFSTLVVPESVTQLSTAIEAQGKWATDWQRALGSMDLNAGLTKYVASVSQFADAAAVALQTIDLNQVGAGVNATIRQQQRLEHLTITLKNRHAATMSSIALTGVAAFPPFVSEVPSIDVFVHGEAVRSVTPHESYGEEHAARARDLRVRVVDETDAFLEVTLPRLNPAFLEQFHGMLARGMGRGADWWTQGAASGGKLLLGVLHSAAPDDAVLPWVTNPKGQIDQHGHPTRKAKVAWLCQFIENDEYRKFVRTELESALALIGLFDAGVHVDAFPDFEDSYDWAVLRVKIIIRHILRIWLTAQRNN